MRPQFAVADVREPLGEAGYLGNLAAGQLEGRSPMFIPGRLTRGPARPTHASPGVTRRTLLLLVAILIGLTSLAAPADGRAARDSYVATDVLNLRVEPSTDADVLAEMYEGEYVAVIDGPTEHGWYYVDYAGINGWAHGRYLAIGGSSGWGGVEVGGATGTAWVGTDALNVRDSPSQDGAVIDTLGQGAELALAGGPEAGFYPIVYGGGIGWVWGEYVSWEAVDAGAERWLDIDRSSGTVRMMVGDEPIATYVASMGYDDSDDGFNATAIGSYRVYEKIAGLTWSPFARAYIKYWVGFDPSRLNGFHGYTMDEDGRRIAGGDGPTAGCVATEPSEAKEIYRFATVGMRVEVHW